LVHKFVENPPLALNKERLKLTPTEDQPNRALNNWALVMSMLLC